MSWKDKRRYLISELPTLLDVLDRIALDEEWFLLNQGRYTGLFPTHYQEGIFETMTMPDGTTQLWPLGLRPFIFYRGESTYHPQGKPSIFRKYMTPEMVFHERIKDCELELLMKTHPMVDIFRNGTMATLHDGKSYLLNLSVDYHALAQHYGIATELMDLTVDKWVAAFFASTKCENGVYKPVNDNDSYGVIYVMKQPLQDMLPSVSPEKAKIRAVGLQPFTRPGEQAGYVYRMNENQNFNKICARKIKFRHDARVSELVFSYANRSKKLFPYDLLQDKATVIKNSYRSSKDAYNLVIARYFPFTPNDTIEEWMKVARISLQDNLVTTFSEVERKQFFEDWKKKEKPFYSRIYIREVYTGPIHEVSGNDLTGYSKTESIK